MAIKNHNLLNGLAITFSARQAFSYLSDLVNIINTPPYQESAKIIFCKNGEIYLTLYDDIVSFNRKGHRINGPVECEIEKEISIDTMEEIVYLYGVLSGIYLNSDKINIMEDSDNG